MAKTRSIPASAGQPRVQYLAIRRQEVYPRECGAAYLIHAVEWYDSGLSPRVRGSPLSPHSLPKTPRSIPASAGQPGTTLMTQSTGTVYPRECGAAAFDSNCNVQCLGLSPRVRGSQLSGRLPAAPLRSIPASAGQPYARLRRWLMIGVYPRECGAAETGSSFRQALGGLSPRVRGSRAQGRHSPRCSRSIPASAGQPPSARRPGRVVSVYPRECGAAFSRWPNFPYRLGLSPRVRGSRSERRYGREARRSIPASAGQPVGDVPWREVGGVYPRECGAAPTVAQRNASGQGLSPRVRGSRYRRNPGGPQSGSIPASAGQPRSVEGFRSQTTVYPRECGAASLSVVGRHRQ